MKRAISSLGVLLLALLGISCTSAPPTGPQFPGVQHPRDTSKAHIYIYSEGIRHSSKDSWILALDGLPLAVISMDSYILIDIVPGEVEFSVDHMKHLNYFDYMATGDLASDILTAVDTAEEARINAQEKFIPVLKREFKGGETYYYKLKGIWKVPSLHPKPEIEEMDEAVALEELEGLGLAGPP